MFPLANKWERRSMLRSVKSAIGMPSLGHPWLGGSIGQVNFYSRSLCRAFDSFTTGSIGGIMGHAYQPQQGVRRMTSKHRSSNAADYPDQPKMIASILNDALGTGDTIAFVKAISDLIRAQGMTLSLVTVLGVPAPVAE